MFLSQGIATTIRIEPTYIMFFYTEQRVAEDELITKYFT